MRGDKSYDAVPKQRLEGVATSLIEDQRNVTHRLYKMELLLEFMDKSLTNQVESDSL
jgi:hypothetical protein